MVQITIEIPDSVYNKLERDLRAGASKKIAETAFMEWADWFYAKRRPINQIEVEVTRVVFLYTEIWDNSTPSANHLGSLLKFTPGHSIYLMRFLQSQYNDMLSRRLLEATLQAVENAQWNGSDSYLIDVHLECKPVIDRILLNLEGQFGVEIRGKRRGDFVRYSLGENHYPVLKEAINAELSNL